jgi:tetratricopeptide (TPR) repeat protein
MKQEFTRQEMLRVVGISPRTLRTWENLGLVEPAEVYSLPQLVALRALVRLRQARLPARKIQAAVHAVRRKLSEVRNPLTDLRLYSEGSRIRVQVGHQHMEPESGQLLLNFEQQEIERMVAIPSRPSSTDRQIALQRQQEAERWFLRGLELEQSGAPVAEAIEAYQKAVDYDPRLAAAHVNLGTIFFNARDWDRAAACYRRALEANPNYPLAHFNLANLYDETGQPEQALTHYQAALKLDPNYADAHYNLALLFQAGGHTLKAVRHWQRYLKLDPSSGWATIARRELAKLSSAVVIASPKVREVPVARSPRQNSF